MTYIIEIMTTRVKKRDQRSVRFNFFPVNRRFKARRKNKALNEILNNDYTRYLL